MYARVRMHTSGCLRLLTCGVPVRLLPLKTWQHECKLEWVVHKEGGEYW